MAQLKSILHFLFFPHFISFVFTYTLVFASMPHPPVDVHYLPPPKLLKVKGSPKPKAVRLYTKPRTKPSLKEKSDGMPPEV
jgi:hypothetical protein